MRTFLSQWKDRHPLFFWNGWLNLFLFLVLWMISMNSDLVVQGANAWYKPMKFALSTWIYLLTLAWFMPYYPDGKAKKNIVWTILSVMYFEITCITFQAARGVISHFNIDGIFNMIVFQLMGLAILANTIALVFFVLKLRKNLGNSSDDTWKRSIIWGIWILIISSLEGFVMGAILKHTVGAADGGPGIPFLNWSKIAGDLRIAHFVGIHGMQILPLVGLILVRYIPISKHSLIIHLTGILYLILVAGLFIRAIMGLPLSF